MYCTLSMQSYKQFLKLKQYGILEDLYPEELYHESLYNLHSCRCNKPYGLAVHSADENLNVLCMAVSVWSWYLDNSTWYMIQIYFTLSSCTEAILLQSQWWIPFKSTNIGELIIQLSNPNIFRLVIRVACYRHTL